MKLMALLLLLTLFQCSFPEQLYEVWQGDLSSHHPLPLVPQDTFVDEKQLPKLQWKLYLERLQVLPDYKLMFCLIGRLIASTLRWFIVILYCF